MCEYTIQDLIEQTGIPRRTIYFYTQQNILPPLQGAGLSARYQQVHLLRLKLIPLLRRQGLRLDQIREYFDGQDESALESRLKEEESVKPLPRLTTPPTPLPGSFIHYALSQGMTLIVPAEIVSSDSARVKEIIRTIQEKMERD